MSEWISVEEKLPEQDGTYLVCTANSRAFVTHFYVGSARWGHHPRHIAYWMPLPEPPEEQRADRTKERGR